jgi:hypothetical protein
MMKRQNVDEYDELPEEDRIGHDFVLALTRLHAPPELQAITRIKVATLHAKSPKNQCCRRNYTKRSGMASR